MAIGDLKTAIRNLAAGHGVLFPLCGVTGTPTAGAAASGHFTAQVNFNAVGTTLPGTLVGLQIPAPSASLFLANWIGQHRTASEFGLWLVRLYKLGTLVLAATGNQFTANDSPSNFPVLRTQFGAGSKPLTLIPLLQVTTATATTAPQFLIREATPGPGYLDQDGNSIEGTKTFIFPAAATAANSWFVLKLEHGDSGVRDITDIDVTVAASAGAASLWGAEMLGPLGFPGQGRRGAYHDALAGGLSMVDLKSGTASNGTLTTHLALLALRGTNTDSVVGWLIGTVNA